jgi:predicted nucleotidyltransferase
MSTPDDHLAHGFPPRLDEGGLAAFLATQPDVIAAYVFGSLAQGRATARSDVDIALLLMEPIDPVALAERRLQLMGHLEPYADHPVDVVVLNRNSILLQHQALSTGRLLYERDREARVSFEVMAGKLHADSIPARHFFLKALFAELDQGGLSERRRNDPGTAPVSAKRDRVPEE